MKLTQKVNSALSRLGKYKYAVAVLLLGLVLMLWPQSQEQVQTPSEASLQVDSLAQVQEQLQAILSQIDGAGRVQVMLTLKTGEERVYQQDAQLSATETDSQSSMATVMRDDGGSQTSPVVRMVHYPIYQGAVVVCDGGDKAGVQLRVTQAVCSLTGLGSDKVSVIKMKGK